MDLRSLDMAQQAVPILLRHLSAYAELAEKDIAATKKSLSARAAAAAWLVASGCFGVLMLCALVIALTWDGNYRVAAISLLAGFFAVSALCAFALLKKRRLEPFADLRREWRRDKELFAHLLDKHPAEPSLRPAPTADPSTTPHLVRTAYERASR